MTLILSLGNPKNVVMFGDRRLTSNGAVVDEDSNKLAVLDCLDSRLAVGYTGLSRIDKFDTRNWLHSAIVKCSPPEFTIGRILERVKLDARETFCTNNVLANSPLEHVAVSILFSGFLYFENPPPLGYALISNFQLHECPPSTNHDFRIKQWTEKRPIDNMPSFVNRVGNISAITTNDVYVLRELMLKDIPRKGIVGKTIEVFRDIGHRPLSGNTIGDNILSLQIPADKSEKVISQYHSTEVEHRTCYADMIFLHPNGQVAIKDISLSAVDKEETQAIVVPKVRRNHPCPCGSGKKYKRCHGR